MVIKKNRNENRNEEDEEEKEEEEEEEERVEKDEKRRSIAVLLGVMTLSCLLPIKVALWFRSYKGFAFCSPIQRRCIPVLKLKSLNKGSNSSLQT